jgi:PAS domain S-box-containing protein
MYRMTNTDYQLLFESLPGAYLLLLPDLAIAAASDAYLGVTMTKRENITGMQVFEAFPINPNGPSGGSMDGLRVSLNHVLKYKTAHTMPDFRYDIRRPDGSFEERYWCAVNTPILNSNKEITWIVHKVEDITEKTRLRKHEIELQRLNEELQEEVWAKNEQLTGIFERITDGFIALDKDFRYTYANKKIGELTHMDPQWLLGKLVWEVFPEAKESSTYKAFKEAMDTQRFTINTDYYAPLDLWQQNFIYPSPEGLSVFIRDISESKRSEESLRASEEKYRFLFESNPLPMWMLSMPDRNFIAVNDAAVKHYGYSREEFLRMNAADIRPPEEVKRYMESLKQMKPGIYSAGIWPHKKKDGTIIQVEITAHDTYLEHGPARIIMANDVTERLQAEEALKLSEETNRLIMNSSLNAIVCMDLSGKIIVWNLQAENIFGWAKEEVLGLQLSDTIIPPRYRERHRAGFENYLKTGDGPLLNKMVEISAINKKGVEFPVELAIIPIKEGTKEFFCSFIQDITVRKIAEEQLKQSHEQLRQLASHLQSVREDEQKRIAREVHDELGQQITGLKMDISWIWKKLATVKGAEIVEERIRETSSLLDSTVKTIRKIASELRPSVLDDLGVIAALEWQAKEFERRSGIPVTFNTPITQLELEPHVATGIFRLYQEALTNVARHSQATQVNTELSLTKGLATLTITDNGIGFDVNESGGRKTLGLLGMKERALMMSGRLQIKSKPGKGTTVIITIPIRENVKETVV